MRSFLTVSFLVIALLILHATLTAQTTIQFIVKDYGQHRIEKADAFDLSQEEIHEYAYKDTILMHFNKRNIDCYNIRYHENGKMFRQQLWLDTGNIKIEAHIDSGNLIIDTVMNSPAFYMVKDFAKKYFSISQTKDTAATNTFLLQAYQDNINNPFSIVVADYYIRLNQNIYSNLAQIKTLVDRQGSRFSWFLLYPAAVERLNKILETSKINIDNFSFVTKDNTRTKLSLEGTDFYVLDFWFLGCPPCLSDHKDIKTSYDQLLQKKVELISISTDENFRQWKSYLLNHNYIWQNYLEDRKNSLTKQLGISAFPTYIILDKKGNIVNTYNSFDDVRKKYNIL